MKFHFHNFGYFDHAEIELGDLTLICGKNNTGKTYINYALYGFLEGWKGSIDLKLDEETG